ncbi:hypothetical protein D3C79_638890 [compost metagenome]
MHVDQVGARVEVIAPDLLENHHPRDHLAAVAHQVLQQLVLGGQQVEGVVTAARFVADQVQLQIGNLQAGLGRGYAVTTQQYLDSRGHFVGGERLGQVVVSAGTQAAHPLIDVGEGADHQDRRSDLEVAQGGDDGQAVDLGQHAVQGDQVVAARNGFGQAFTAIVGPIHFQAVAGKFGDDFLAGDGVVFDGQYARHAGSWASNGDLIVPKNRQPAI